MIWWLIALNLYLYFMGMVCIGLATKYQDYPHDWIDKLALVFWPIALVVATPICWYMIMWDECDADDLP